MSPNYVPGDRLWVRLEGYDWWPARVLSDGELAAKLDGQTREPGCDLAVLFYPGSQTAESISQFNSREQAHNICYFESSSEKAVTDSEDLRVAIQLASEDAAANALKTDDAPTITPHVHSAAGHSAKAAAVPSTSAAASRKATVKRIREDDDDSAFGRDEELRGPVRVADEYKTLPVSTLKSLAQRISTAVAAEDVPSLRIILCELDRVDVSLSQLEESKIGVAVGSIVGSEACRPLRPLARALVSFWARHLDHTTIAAIRRVQEERGKRAGAGDTDFAPGSPTSPASPLRLTTYTSSSAVGSPLANGGTQPRKPAAGGAEPRVSFISMLCKLLDNPDNSVPVKTETIESVARELAAELKDADERGALLTRLRNPELSFLRDNLLTGRWTAKQYSEQPDEAFVTEKEKEAERRRVAEKMKAFDNLANVGLNMTEMFKCANCGSRKCTFYEQQTRGADEPTTKFITCMECKKAWTEE